MLRRYTVHRSRGKSCERPARIRLGAERSRAVRGMAGTLGHPLLTRAGTRPIEEATWWRLIEEQRPIDRIAGRVRSCELAESTGTLLRSGSGAALGHRVRLRLAAPAAPAAVILRSSSNSNPAARAAPCSRPSWPSPRRFGTLQDRSPSPRVRLPSDPANAFAPDRAGQQAHVQDPPVCSIQGPGFG